MGTTTDLTNLPIDYEGLKDAMTFVGRPENEEHIEIIRAVYDDRASKNIGEPTYRIDVRICHGEPERGYDGL